MWNFTADEGNGQSTAIVGECETEKLRNRWDGVGGGGVFAFRVGGGEEAEAVFGADAAVGGLVFVVLVVGGVLDGEEGEVESVGGDVVFDAMRGMGR